MACILLISNAGCAPSLKVILFICFHCMFHIFCGFRCSFVHFFSIWISVFFLFFSFSFMQLDFGFSHTFSYCQTCWLFFVFHVYVHTVRHVHFSLKFFGDVWNLFIVSLFKCVALCIICPRHKMAHGKHLAMNKILKPWSQMKIPMKIQIKTNFGNEHIMIFVSHDKNINAHEKTNK